MRRLFTRGWLLFHLAVWVLVAAFLVLGWWQWTRAAGGNTLSFGYMFQWPAFAGFVIFVWIREMRKTLRDAPAASAPEPVRESRVRRVERPATTTEDDPELVRYNDYLAWLNANPQASPADYHREVH